MAKDKQGEVDFENTIERLLIVRGGSKSGKNVCVQKQKKYSQINQYQLEIEAPLKIFGDAMFMFKYFDHLRIFEHGGYPPESNYLFLGDYVHRGKQSLETICLLLPQKIKYPENFFLLRGNHASINRIHIFYDEINKTTIKKKQTTIYNQIMKNIYRLFQLFACGSINR